MTVYVPITSETMCDGVARDDLNDYIERGIDQYLRPWAYPDRCRFPSLDLFPRATKAVAAATEACRRVRDAWRVLRYGYELDGDRW